MVAMFLNVVASVSVFSSRLTTLRCGDRRTNLEGWEVKLAPQQGTRAPLPRQASKEAEKRQRLRKSVGKKKDGEGRRDTQVATCDNLAFALGLRSFVLNFLP